MVTLLICVTISRNNLWEVFLREVGIVGKSGVTLKTCKLLTTGWRPHRIAGFQGEPTFGKMLPGCSVGYWLLQHLVDVSDTWGHWKPCCIENKKATPPSASQNPARFLDSWSVKSWGVPWGWIFETSYPWHLTRAVQLRTEELRKAGVAAGVSRCNTLILVLWQIDGICR